MGYTKDFTLIELDKKASDGSVVPTSVATAFLNSPEYRNMIDNKRSFICITHINRKQSSNSSKRIGVDDNILLNKANIGFISKCFIDRGHICATAEFFNEEDFPNDVANNIKYITGMLKAGSKLGVSVVLDAQWNAQEIAKKINTLEGMDFTQNPSYKAAKAI